MIAYDESSGSTEFDLMRRENYSTIELSRRQVLAAGSAAAATLILADLFSPRMAHAASYKTVKQTPVRNGPSILSTQVDTLPAGSVVDVGSQCAGSRIESGKFANNATWNRLTDGRFIHDHYLDTPANKGSVMLTDGLKGYVKFTRGIPRMTAEILGRDRRDAAAWLAETQLGITAYDGYCLQFGKVAWWSATNNTTIWRSFGNANGAWRV